jgi:hypothetical protein
VAHPKPTAEVFTRGGWGTVEFVVRANGKSPSRDFLDHLESVREKSARERPDANGKARFVFLFQQMANSGHLSAKRFSPEMGKLFAFRHEVRKIQFRFPCFLVGNRWLLTHGFQKPGAQKKRGDWPQSEIDRANEIMHEYLKGNPTR